MSWNLTMLAVHVLAGIAFAVLFGKTPDALQRLVIGLLIAATTLMVYAYSSSLIGRTAVEEPIRWIAQEVEHVAVLFYVFRLFWIEHICHKTCSLPSPSLPR